MIDPPPNVLSVMIDAPFVENHDPGSNTGHELHRMGHKDYRGIVEHIREKYREFG